MKKISIIITLLLYMNSLAQCPWNFTVYPSSGNFSITCMTPILQVTAIDNNSNTVNYVYSSPGFTTQSYQAAITQPGNYTIVASDPSASCSITRTFAVAMNTTAPSNTLAPLTMSIACNGNPVSFTATAITPSTGIQHRWYSPINPLPGGVPILSSNNPISVLSGTQAPGIYTLETVDINNGCTADKNFTITSTSAFPTFSVASPTNFSIGCSPLNQTTISIINPISTQTPPATCSYTFLSPGFVGPLTPSIILSVISATTVLSPGIWTVIVEDNNNFCRTELWVPITQDITPPNVSAIVMPTDTLTCKNPTIYAIGTSTTPETTVGWLMPVNPPSLPNYSVIIGKPCCGPVTSTNSTFYASYTVVVTNTITACQSTSVISIHQNFKPPVSNPAISAPGVICDEFAQLVVGNSTVTSGVPGASVYPYLWEGPPPQSTMSGQSFYNAYVSGTYSLTVQDSYNGCLKTGTINVSDNSPQFTLQGIAPGNSVSCNGTVIIQPTVVASYSVSVSMGSLSASQPTTVTNLCYGQLKVCLTYTATGCKKCDSIQINQYTLVRELTFEKDLNVYPNPASSSFLIEIPTESAHLSIFNPEGEKVKEMLIRSGQNINIESLDPGIYFLLLKAENSIGRRKLVVTR